MGIDICRAHTVSLNETHELRLVTGVNRNPVVSKKSGLEIKCVYRRTKHGDHERDGNPFIYALKGKRPYSITSKELFRFRPSFKQIIHKMDIQTEVNFVLGMPSSHNVVTHFGNRVARKLGATYIDDYFAKQKIGDILANFDITAVHKNHKKAVNNVLSKYEKLDPEQEISLKKIRNNIRHYFEPVKLNPSYENLEPNGHILLVDDLLSTGTTLLSAERLLKSQGACVQSAFCLLSDLTTRK
ncbi:phosphoribosyltransferase family protein [Psychrosphaera sp. 1_MG-2023]|uniref:phosphoribosyltransferase family protein n=1 Tax=Psychrosphaera sp. 1_MG-2023 TaxID=3062643 RepID=UPI0026E1864C|nr:phosphoribosyltransferase family protein [Psychrosphaera sp. 1_MG-2023]MDO6719708.1 phosphoribosyltransferase family protein [Psychrosphaera sp. 1_MG-2023]